MYVPVGVDRLRLAYILPYLTMTGKGHRQARDCLEACVLVPESFRRPRGGGCGGKNLYWSAALCYSWRSRPCGHSTGPEVGARVDGTAG
jgi:hypothetical protein